MAEEVGMEIKKFSAIVVIKFSELLKVQTYSKESLHEFTMCSSYKEIFNSIDYLSSFYNDFIDEVNIDIIEKRCILSSKKEYMAYLVARGLKLSEDDPTFFEFLLVCIFIAKIAKCVFDKHKCCKVLKVTADSLEAIYVRKYWNYFKENDEFLGFSRLCKKINRSLNYVEFEDGEHIALLNALEPSRNRKVQIFKFLNDIRDDISLNGMELKLLKDKSLFVPNGENDDFLISPVSGAGESRELDKKWWEVVLEEAIKTGIRCSRCDARCFQYFPYSVKEFPR